MYCVFGSIPLFLGFRGNLNSKSMVQSTFHLSTPFCTILFPIRDPLRYPFGSFRTSDPKEVLWETEDSIPTRKGESCPFRREGTPRHRKESPLPPPVSYDGVDEKSLVKSNFISCEVREDKHSSSKT